MPDLTLMSGWNHQLHGDIDSKTSGLHERPQLSDDSIFGLPVPLLSPRSRCPKNGRSFACRVFRFTVGPYQQDFTVHESALSKSPVLDRMCKGPFQESAERHVRLPEDDADDFGCILEYLYLMDYAMDLEDPDVFDRLANVYILAEKYQMEPLKSLTVKKFRNGLTSSQGAFFRVAQAIYQDTPDSDRIFRSYFAATAPEILLKLSADQFPVVRGIIQEGGILAVDIFEAWLEAHRLEAARRPGPGINEHETRVFAALKRRDVTKAGLSLDQNTLITGLSHEEITATFEGLCSHGLIWAIKGQKWSAVGDHERVKERSSCDAREATMREYPVENE